MNITELPGQTAHDLSQCLAQGKVKCRELMQAFLERIEAHEPRLGAFVSVHADTALEAAEAADRARASGHAAGPWHGIPIAVKDIIDIEGQVTTGGSAVWRDRVSPATATLVRKLVAAGMVVIGKTHTVEFAMGSWGTNQHMGTPANPWDTDVLRAPGGSSAGSAVSVAAGFAPWAIGTDTGGSVRIPSSYCGLTGLKTTFGRVSCHGVLPLSTTLDTPGPLCLDVADAASLFAVLQGPDPLDPNTLGRPAYDEHRWRTHRPEGWVLGTLAPAERAGVSEEVLAAYDEALEVWRHLGATLVEAPFPVGLAELGREVGVIIGVEGYSFVGHLADDPSAPVDDDVRPRIALGRDVSAPAYVELLRRRQGIINQFEAAWAGLDAIITPGATTTAPAVADIDQTTTAATFTRPFNYLGRCALALPNGLSSDGLPLSVQVACQPYREDLALAIGGALQQHTDWHERRATLP